MTQSLPVPIGGTKLQSFAAALDSAAAYAGAEKAQATRRAYTGDFERFRTWCKNVGAEALPATPATAASYLAHLADSGKKAATISRAAAAIAYAHRLAGSDPPTNAETVRAVHRGIRRTIGTASTGKSPVTAKVITAMLKKVPDTLAGKRDRALLLTGFAAALRRSELVALDVADIEMAERGMVLTIGGSKTDQERAGAAIAVPNGSKLQPVAAIRAWLAAAAIDRGAVFRRVDKADRVLGGRLTAGSVALVVKRYAGSLQLDAPLFSGHSLRAGFVTSALDSGADVLKIMKVTRHKDVKTVTVYDRREPFEKHAGKGFL